MRGHVNEVYLSFRPSEGEDVRCLLNATRTGRDGRPVNDAVLMPFEERTQYEDEILQAEQAAEQANRAKDEFLSTVSHELRTPISTIKSLSQYLSMGVRGPVSDEQTDYLNRIEAAAGYLDTLINDILDFARLEAGSVPTTSKLTSSIRSCKASAPSPRTLRAGWGSDWLSAAIWHGPWTAHCPSTARRAKAPRVPCLCP
ncbi:MAG: hypothetical protein BRD55_05145 [Bacteroidetes bacterium SW_9_63_38]|nr:MAG: hypothetical protein BRD55_05145 [Bacteroidetes bacterium SW_9_63_38]